MRQYADLYLVTSTVTTQALNQHLMTHLLALEKAITHKYYFMS